MNRKPRVLIVDDEEIVRLNIERILEQEYDVQSTSNGEEALRLIKSEDFALVLTDLVMEGMDGFKLLEEIQRLTSETVVIVITGYGSLPSAIAAMQRGAYDYILKPCSKEELLIRVKKSVEKGELDKRLLQVQKMETILSNMGVFIVDELGILISVNPTLKERFWGDLEVVGKKMSQLPCLKETSVVEDIATALKGESVEREEVKIQTSGSRQNLIISYHVKPLDIKDGQVKNVAWIVEDRTKRTHIMQQISQAERLTSLGKLAAGVAHEINNPLNIISLDVEYVKGQLDPDNPMQENLQSISEEVERIARIVQQLQDQTRIQESLHDSSNLQKILSNHIFQIVFTQLRKNAVKIKLDLEENQGDLLMPKSKLTQVLMNLIKNAEEAMSKGGTLTIASSTVKVERNDQIKNVSGAKQDKIAKITISDTGTGIKKEHRVSIFEPFFTTKGFDGTGLGLFICYTIIKGYHGTLDVESEEGVGTTFTLSLPFAEIKESAYEK